ncbi:hypothetical protein HDU67_008159 [Dinochytrium kinnereticum]|nr:hypothetical protein HDU67_008159 [Dinochytrium kinnereticum]
MRRSSVGGPLSPGPPQYRSVTPSFPLFGHTQNMVSGPSRATSPPARRSITPQPSSRPNQMYQPPLSPRNTSIRLGSDEERGRSVSRIYRNHPVWDAADRSEISERLYGPLISTVRELSEAAAASSMSELSSSTASSPPQAKKSTPTTSVLTLSSSASGSNTTLHSTSSSSKLNETSPLLTTSSQTRTEASVINSLAPVPSSSARTAAQSSSRHTSRAIVHALTSPYPKTRYRVGWDAQATAALRWALPDRVLDWGFNALSAAVARERDEKEKEEKDRERRASDGELAIANPA